MQPNPSKLFLFQIHDLCYETNGTSSLQMKKRCDEMFWWNIMQLCPPSFSLGIGIRGDNLGSFGVTLFADIGLT